MLPTAVPGLLTFHDELIMNPAKTKGKPSPYQRIVRAAERGTGARITAEEASWMAIDGAIETRASLDDEIDAGCTCEDDRELCEMCDRL